MSLFFHIIIIFDVIFWCYIWCYFFMLISYGIYGIFDPIFPKITCLDFVPQSGCVVVAFEGCWFFDLTFWRYFSWFFLRQYLSMLFFNVTFLHSYFLMLYFDVNFYHYFVTLSTYLMLFFYFVVWFYCLTVLLDVTFDVTFLCSVLISFFYCPQNYLFGFCASIRLCGGCIWRLLMSINWWIWLVISFGCGNLGFLIPEINKK